MGLSFATLLLVAQASLVGAVEHKPVEKVVRGQPITIKATIHGHSPSFSPLVFARANSKGRFFGYPMAERGKDQWVARLPQSVAVGPVFDYFIESRLANGERTTAGSQEKPFQVTVEDAVILPARVEVTSEPGAVISLDGKVQGEAPQTLEAPAGKHTISVTLGDGRGAEQTVEFAAGKTRQLKLAPSAAGGPGRMTVNSEPHGARVYLDGKLLGTTPFVGDVAPGEHTLAVEADGFLRQERQVSQREGHDVELGFALLALPKDPALSIESVPPGASVFIDGVAKGTAPWLGPLAAGRHEVVLKLAGRRETASDFEMPEGKDLALRLELAASQGPANSAPQLLVGSRPDGATVKIDGAEVGTTPWQGEVKAGAHTVSIALEGFVAEERQVTAHNNREADVDFVLQRPPGPAKLTVESDPMGADITVDGQVVGTTPLSQEVLLEAGEHQVEARRQGFVAVAQTVTVEQAQTASLRLAMAPAPKEPLPPTIAVSTEPSGARLYVDGKLAGETPYRMKSKPGPHDLKLVLDGYVSRTAKVKLPEDSGFELRVAATMHRSRGSDQVERPDAVAIARGQLKRAQACYKLADYACALTNYKAVYAVKPVPELVFNVGQSYRKLGQLKEAAAAFRTYVKEKPDGPLAKQAELLAQQCDEALARGESKVAEDDNTPPVLHHASPGKVTRGQAVTLTAVITDDKSGVDNPQACFKTLFQSEYSCLPLQPGATKDEYSVTLPAKASTDGLAYYLEASDAAGNGPTLFGSATAPATIAIEEPGAIEDAARAAAKPPPPPPLVVLDEEGQPITSTQMQLSRPAKGPWSVSLFLGAEHTSVDYGDGSFSGRGTISLRRTTWENQAARIEFGLRTGRQDYRTLSPAPGQPSTPLELNEQRLSVAGSYGLDITRVLDLPSRFFLMPLAYIKFERTQNEVYPTNYLGLGGQLLAKADVWGPLGVSGMVVFTANPLSNNDTGSVGAPRREVDLRGGVELHLPPRYSIHLAWSTDILMMTNERRISNGIAAGVSMTF